MTINWKEKIDDLDADLNNPFEKGESVNSNSGKTELDTEQDRIRGEVLSTLEKLGSLSVKDDGIKFEGDNIVLPARFSGNLKSAARFIVQIHDAEETEFGFNRSFKYRPWDGAAAFQRALYRVFGTTGLGKATQTMFGEIPPQYVSIAVGFGKTEQVPWGEVAMPTLDATFDLDSVFDPEYGALFSIHVTAPRKRRKHIEAFFDVVEDELKGSVRYRKEPRWCYHGKACSGKRLDVHSRSSR